METDYLKLAAENQKRAREVIAESQIEQIWQRHGATVNLVGYREFCRNGRTGEKSAHKKS